MTGLLFLADRAVDRFWYLLPHVSILLAVGWICYFAERLFVDGESDFSRKNFGYAFKTSGSLVLLTAFCLLAGGQLVGRLAEVFTIDVMPLIATDKVQKLWAIGLLGGSCIGYVIDRVLVSKSPWTTVWAIGLFCWMGLAVLDLCAVRLQVAHVAIVAGVYLAVAWWFSSAAAETASGDALGTHRRIGFVLPFGSLAIVGAFQYTAQFLYGDGHFLFANNGVLVGVQLLVVAINGYVGWKKTGTRFREMYLSVGSMFAVLGMLSPVLALSPNFDIIAVVAFIAPVACAVMALLFAKPVDAQAWQNAAMKSLWFTILCLLVARTELRPNNLPFTLFWTSAVSALTLFAAAYDSRRILAKYAAYLMTTFAISQLLCLAGITLDFALVLSASLGGITLATSARFLGTGNAGRTASQSTDQTEGNLSGEMEEVGNLLALFGGILGVLLAVNRLFANETSVWLLLTLLTQLAAVLAAALLTQSVSWRAGFRAIGIANVLVVVLVINSSISTHWLQRVELAAVLLGIALLVIGHIAWYREGDTPDAGATSALGWGSMLVVAPLACGLVYFRCHHAPSIWNWWFFHEVTSIMLALTLLGLGLACRIRSTTIGGVSLLAVYVVSLVTLVQWPSQLKNVSVLMIVGGGVFFTTAVLLSVYRDKILALPQEIRQRRGVFRVLHWR